jgi:hypothetical protein
MGKWWKVAAVIGLVAIARELSKQFGWDKDAALELLGEWSDRLGVWAMPVYVGIHTISLSLLALRCFFRGWCFFAVWVLACCSLCLLCQGLRCLSFLLDRQVLQNVFICFSFLFDWFPDRVFLCFYQLVPLLIQ